MTPQQLRRFAETGEDAASFVDPDNPAAAKAFREAAREARQLAAELAAAVEETGDVS
jgi:hypothetical protein